jgi:sec-independent protein translocase protein TatB
MFDIGPGEFVALAVIAIIVLGPEKLPRYAADAARMLRNLRRMANDARDEVTRELGPEFSDLSVRDLDPRTMVRKHLLDPLELDDDDEPKARGRGPGEVPRAESGRTSPATPPPYDPDAT